MLRLVVNEAGIREMQELERTLSHLVTRLSSDDRRDIRERIAEGFGRNFDDQRSGAGVPWAPLRPSTMRDRLLHGFPKDRPILQRTGDYRDTLENLDNPDHYSLARATDGTLILEEASNSPLYGKHEGGEFKIPARPAGELSRESERLLGQTVDEVITRLLGRLGL